MGAESTADLSAGTNVAMSVPMGAPINAPTSADAPAWATLGLSSTVAAAAQALGWMKPTPVQTQTAGPVVQGRDVWVTAPTGSGKTLAYALPLCEHFIGSQHFIGAVASLPTTAATKAHASTTRRAKRATTLLVLVPTRELALQVGAVFKNIFTALAASPANSLLKLAVVYGGVSINPQMMALRGGADVVVATPGRLLDLVAHNAVQLDQVQHLVLDEADRLLGLGFADELQQLLNLCPTKRQTLLFSATFEEAVQGLARDLLQQPVSVTVQAKQLHTRDIQQRAIAVDEKNRTRLLRHLIAQHQWPRVLVFVATRYTCEHLANKLYQAGVYATALHGEMTQSARQQVLEEFKEARWEVLITTDLAARGIDIAQLPAVVNYDLPRSATDYTHRIGRTGRAGEVGQAVTFVTPAHLAHWQLIQKRHGLQLPLEEVAGMAPANAVTTLAKTETTSKNAQQHAGPAESPVQPTATPWRDPNLYGGVKGKRPSKKDKLRAAAQADTSDPGASDA